MLVRASVCVVFNVFVDSVCELLCDVVRFLFLACCVVFVRVCFVTSALVRVFV